VRHLAGVTWCVTPSAVVPVDPWLCELLESESYIAYGIVRQHSHIPEGRAQLFDLAGLSQNAAVLRWDGVLYGSPHDASDFLRELGFSALGEVTGCRVVASIWVGLSVGRSG
jgi:hypothetical protein